MPAAEHHCHLVGTNLHVLETEAIVCEQLVQCHSLQSTEVELLTL